MPRRARCCLAAAVLLAPLPASALTAYALNAAGTSVLRFDTRSPGNAPSLPIAGLLAGEKLLSLDFRPRTRTLYAVSSANRVLIVEPGFAFVTPVGGAFTPALTGTLFDMDFNAASDRIRVVSDADQDLRLDPGTGAVAGVDTALDYATGDPNDGIDPNVVGVAHTASFAGASTTTLFDIDSGTDVLATQLPANVGTLNTVGPLGVPVVAAAPAGFDMLRTVDGNEAAFAALSTTGTSSTLFRINLATGAATAIGAIGSPPQLVRGLALRDDEEPDAFVVTASNQLVRFNLANPGVIASPLPIVGLQPGETLRCLDWRPRTQQLVAIGTTDRLYAIQPETGFTLPAPPSLSAALTGAAFGCDVNPVVDRIRVVNDIEQNLRVNPTDGNVIIDTPLAYVAGDPNAGADPQAVAAGYTASYQGATVTSLFVVDAAQNVLTTVANPNGGTLATVGSLGIDVVAATELDVAAIAGRERAFLLAGVGPSSTSTLYALDLTTGSTSPLGVVDANLAITAIRGFAIRSDTIAASGYE